ncbi:hypothetical protein [Actinomadura rubrisoli]|uniref:Uncharacterized protein n=1 Tax=Actinomadura rubrisoli TaxID=2530368 RepID=A0A4R4ZV89_9ACTN|nr:hypothetical protein [Actinomadura rubrisoli]TDD62805.1 hypothetical protein E1298_44310 [Actinomadura rubrisoli]
MTVSASNSPGNSPGPDLGRPSPWVLPEDGIVDPIAVEIAATGARRVALTRTERLLAAARILAAGHPCTEISRRLHVSGHTARTLAAQLRDLGPVPDVWAPANPGAA